MPFDPNAPFALTFRSRWGGFPKSGQQLLLFYFNVLDGKSKADGSVGERLMGPSGKCCLSNTRLKTALRSVQNASLSLPVGACALVWACDGGGHPKVALSGHSGA